MNFQNNNSMELNIKDRIYIPQVLPQQNNFMEFNMKRAIIQKVSLTESDKETYNIQEDKEHGRITWDMKKDMELPLVVDFTKEEIKYLQESCEKLVDAPYADDFWATVEKIYNESQK